VAGGTDDFYNPSTYSQHIWNDAEMYDPVAKTFAPVNGVTSAARFAHAASLLSNGMVLISGGANGAVFSSTDLYDPATGFFIPSGDLSILSILRIAHSSTLLPNGKVLLAAGQTIGGNLSATAELFTPFTIVPITVTPVNLTLGTGKTQQFTAR